MIAPEKIHSDETLHLFGWRDLLILVPRSSDGSFDTVRTAMQEFRDRVGGRFSLLTLILPGAKPPSREAKQQIDLELKRFENELNATAVLIEGTGFFASIFISLGSIALSLRNTAHPTHVCTSAASAAAFLNPRLNGSMEEELTAMIEGIGIVLST